MEKIFEKAVLGGYLVNEFGYGENSYENFVGYHEGSDEYAFAMAVSDPKFGECLGKACGWLFNLPALTDGDCGTVWRAKRFMEILVTKGIDESLAYLESVVK